ncbi:MAG: hypothetical protein QXP81_02240 [Nitrososphaerota archaeon]|nr:hypothetical protein [Candidatus Calditenuis fumarioli]
MELSLFAAGLGVCHVPVIDERSHVMGVVTPYELLNVIERNQSDFIRSLMSMRVSDVVHPVPLMSVEDEIDEVVRAVLDDQCRCAILIDSAGQPVAVVSGYDALRLTLSIDELSRIMADTPISALSGKVKVLPFETTVRQAVTALVANKGEAMVIEQTDFAVTSSSLVAALLSPKDLLRSVRRSDEVLDSYLVYENEALVKMPVMGGDKSLKEAIRFVSDAKVEVLRLDNGGFVTLGSVIRFVQDRLRGLRSA